MNGSDDDDARAARAPKRVKFDPENPGRVVGLVESLSDQERLESWYSSSEFAASKDSVKELCRSYRQSRRYSDCLTQAYNAACGLADRQDETTTDDSSSPEENPETKKGAGEGADLPDQGFTQWMQGGSRGLEGYSSRLHAMRRQRHFQDTKHAVFLEQARQNLSQYKDDTMLAKQAEQSSRRARSFAFLLGQADAWAAQKEDESKEEYKEEEEDGSPPSSSEFCANENERNWEKETDGVSNEKETSWENETGGASSKPGDK